MRNLFFLCAALLLLVSCQFTETMVLNEDGSGTMSLQMDLGEMMAFGGEMSQDSTFVKQDTVISFKALFEEKKDSIAQLPAAEQARLKAMERYNLRMVTDPEENTFVLDVFTDFSDVSQANDLLRGLEQTDNLMPDGNNGPDDQNEDPPSPETLGVRYSFDRSVFKRDAYIKDKAAHQAELDSLKQAESFLKSINYKIKYTFPKRIKSSSVKDATYSLDGKTMELERSFLDYFKNPDLLDVEVILEDK